MEPGDTDRRLLPDHLRNHDAGRILHVLDGTQPQGMFKLFRDIRTDLCHHMGHRISGGQTEYPGNECTSV